MANCIFITPLFFDYPQIIEHELSKYFKEVFTFYSTPRGLIYKACSFLSMNQVNRYLLYRNSDSIKKNMDSLIGDVDLILIIKASLLSEKICMWLRKRFPHAKIIQYLWDNISTDALAIKTLPLFDTNFSFSPEDCANFGLEFRPFFYTPILVSREKNIDIACIASFSKKIVLPHKGKLSLIF